ncbi:MAG: hypothetical protein V1853_01525 [bacterium]
MSTFVYCPTTGDRVFAQKDTEGIVVVKWQNECRHVVGGVHFYFSAAEPKKHWRSRAKVLATAIIKNACGIAWDECGEVHLIVPHSKAWATFEIMGAASPDGNPDHNKVAMIHNGVAWPLFGDAGQWEVIRELRPSEDGVALWKREGNRVEVTLSDSEEAVYAANWHIAEVSGGAEEIA